MIRIILLVIAALWTGCAGAFLTHVVLFTTPVSGLFPQILLPVVLLAGMCVLAGFVLPPHSRAIALLTVAPLVLTSLLVLVSNLLDGTVDVNYSPLHTYLAFPIIIIVSPLLALSAAKFGQSLRKTEK